MEGKKGWAIGLCLVVLLAMGGVQAEKAAVEISFVIGQPQITINGNTMPVEATYTVNDTTLVPVRVITEAFGAQVDWLGETESVSIVLGDRAIMLTIGSATAVVDGEEKPLLAAPVLQTDTTMVPLRFISETFGARVSYDGAADAVLVQYAPENEQPPEQPEAQVLALPAFGVELAAPQGWTQQETSKNRLLLEKRYADGTVDSLYVLVAQTSCTGEEWVKQEENFLKGQYHMERFAAQSGTDSDQNGTWATLQVDVTYPEWETHWRERYLQSGEFGYFVRYGRQEPSPQDSLETEPPEWETVKPVPTPSADTSQPGESPAWEEMENILESLKITGTTLEQVKEANPEWGETQHILSGYDGWQMDVPLCFTKLASEDNLSVFEQQPDGIRLVVTSQRGTVVPDQAGLIKFYDVVPFRLYLPEREREGSYYPPQRKFYDVFGSETVQELKETGNYIFSADVTAERDKDKEAIDQSIFTKITMNLQRDTVRYQSENYFFHRIFLAQVLMPEQTANWLDMDRVYETLQTFKYARKG